MGCTLIRSPPFEGGDGWLASVPTDNGANALALGISALREAPSVHTHQEQIRAFWARQRGSCGGAGPKELHPRPQGRE